MSHENSQCLHILAETRKNMLRKDQYRNLEKSFSFEPAQNSTLNLASIFCIGKPISYQKLSTRIFHTTKIKRDFSFSLS